jgi:hypothetical protein
MLASGSAADNFLNGIVQRLYARAHGESPPTANQGMVVVDDPVHVDRILKSPDQFRKNYSLVSILGRSRFTANGNEWERRRNLTQPNYLEAANSRNRGGIQAIYESKLSNCKSTAPSAIQHALLAAAITVFFGSLHCSVDAEALLRFFARVRPILKMAQYLSWVGAGDVERSRLAVQARDALREYVAEVRRLPDLVSLMDRFRREAGSIHEFLPHEELLMNFFCGNRDVGSNAGLGDHLFGCRLQSAGAGLPGGHARRRTDPVSRLLPQRNHAVFPGYSVRNPRGRVGDHARRGRAATQQPRARFGHRRPPSSPILEGAAHHSYRAHRIP